MNTIDAGDMNAGEFLAAVRDAASRRAATIRRDIDSGLLAIFAEAEVEAYERLAEALFEMEHRFTGETRPMKAIKGGYS